MSVPPQKENQDMGRVIGMTRVAVHYFWRIVGPAGTSMVGEACMAVNLVVVTASFK